MALARGSAAYSDNAGSIEKTGLRGGTGLVRQWVRQWVLTNVPYIGASRSRRRRRRSATAAAAVSPPPPTRLSLALETWVI